MRPTLVSPRSGAMPRWRQCSFAAPLAVVLVAVTCIQGTVAFVSTPRMPTSGSGRMQLRSSGMLNGARSWDETTVAVKGRGLTRREAVNRRTRTTVSRMGVGDIAEGGDGDGDATGELEVSLCRSLRGCLRTCICDFVEYEGVAKRET